MLKWIRENRQEFLLNYTEIGHNTPQADDLLEEHRNFESSCLVSQHILLIVTFSLSILVFFLYVMEASLAL